MAQFAPINYGPPVQADQSGTNAAMQAQARREGQLLLPFRELGAQVQQGADVITRGLLHNQVLEATAKTKETQAKVLDFIDSNRYVTKAQLSDMMGEDYAKWADKNANSGFADKEAVPMYLAAGDLYDSTMRQEHEKNGAGIGLPGWRDNWTAVARTEASTIRERYVNRIAADQMIADNRATAHDSYLRLIDSARTKGDLEAAKAGVEGTTWFSPSEREMLGRMADARKDTLDADTAMSANGGLGDLPTMRKELGRLSGPDAPANYPNITEQARLSLQRRLETQIKTAGAQENVDAGMTWARDIAKKYRLPNSAVVDRTAVLKEFENLKGDPAKIKTAELELNRLMEEGQRAQEDKEGNAFTRGVANIENTGDMGKDVRAILSNPNGTRAAGSYHERLLQIQKMQDKNDPTIIMEHAQAWMFARSALERGRATGKTFEQFIATPVDQEGGTIGTTVDPKKLAPLQQLFIAKQQTEKKNDTQPLSGEVTKDIRTRMKDAGLLSGDINKTLTPEELTIHANIENHVQNNRNAVQDAGGQVKPSDYAQWINEYLEKPPEMHWYWPPSYTEPWHTKTPAEGTRQRPTPAERPDLYRTKDGQTAFYNGTSWEQIK